MSSLGVSEMAASFGFFSPAGPSTRQEYVEGYVLPKVEENIEKIEKLQSHNPSEQMAKAVDCLTQLTARISHTMNEDAKDLTPVSR